MIEPNDRSTLTEALQPPPGYRFDAGVATTYSLSLGTVLGLPAHMAVLPGQEGTAEDDPVRALEGLRRVSQKLSVFCERGRLEAPPRGNALAVMAEGMVHEVRAKHGGSFHPKLWALRFVAEDKGTMPKHRLRLLVLTRNLTWDRCWDLTLCLEGEPMQTKPEGNRNKAVADLLRWLPLNVVGKAPDAARQAMISSLAKDIERASWQLPEGFTQLDLHVLGMGPRPAPWAPFADDEKTSEALIISPFVADHALRVVASRCTGPVRVISRSDELDQVSPSVLDDLVGVHVLKPEMDLSEGEEDGDGDMLHGLHAKMAVFQRGQRVHVAVGSANYTNRILREGTNVEVVAELSGMLQKLPPPSQWLGENYLAPMLDSYTPATEKDPEVAERREIENRLDTLRAQVAKVDWVLACAPAQEASWMLSLSSRNLHLEGCTLQAWPLAVLAERARPVVGGMAELGTFASHEVSALVGFRLTLEDARAAALGVGPVCFALEAKLKGASGDRGDALMAHLLGNRAAFLRYLGLLLDDPTLAGGAGGGAATKDRKGKDAAGLVTDSPLFERLLRMYAREPERLQTIDRMVKRLKGREVAGEPCLPDEFVALWNVVGKAVGKGRAR
ncbi:phospholipase D family protein [uncultured Stenotrophomonas sp.]|uniref:phospholipase D family protein n=1 Tax=uncultured Stenotrophomonas sp. TaxID=165438 RepID=UPI0025E8F43F|nr:phospholipase D family protein [uncultured Stenotrophomonas sp.]